jgi:ATP-dependent Clp protease adapter protein ClpS
MSTETLEKQDTLLDTLSEAFGDLWAVIVHNDDITTFETVINALMDLFAHTREAAELLAWRVHTEGQANVAVGSREFATRSVGLLRDRRINASAELAAS